MTAEPVATLTQHWLGLAPYVVIELRAASDGSGEPAVFLEPGGGAEEQPLILPLLAVSESRAEENPVAEMLRELYAEPDRMPHWRAAIIAVAGEFNPAWQRFVRGENGVPSAEGNDDERHTMSNDPQPVDEQVVDGASTTEHYTGDEIANGAADALHGDRANVEKHEQPAADALESRTLIADRSDDEQA